MVDRHSPKRALTISKIANAVLPGLVSAFVLGVEPGAIWQLGPALTIVMGPRVILATVYTWIQRRVPTHMIGRTMSIFMFIFMGVAPLSAAATGWLPTPMRRIEAQVQV